jgi:hypothetical protein
MAIFEFLYRIVVLTLNKLRTSISKLLLFDFSIPFKSSPKEDRRHLTRHIPITGLEPCSQRNAEGAAILKSLNSGKTGH